MGGLFRQVAEVLEISVVHRSDVSFSRGQIVIHGTTEATEHLVDFAKKNLGIPGDKMFAPKIGECVDASTQSLLYQVCAIV